jgi:hypothetical protein
VAGEAPPQIEGIVCSLIRQTLSMPFQNVRLGACYRATVSHLVHRLLGCWKAAKRITETLSRSCCTAGPPHSRAKEQTVSCHTLTDLWVGAVVAALAVGRCWLQA